MLMSMSMSMLMLRLLAVLFFCFFSTSHAIWFTLQSSSHRCLSEEIHGNVLVMVDYVVVPTAYDRYQNSTISVKVTTPYGNSLHHRENITIGHFAFTTLESGTYLACFWAGKNSGREVSVNLDWKIGIAAMDWSTVAKKERIEGVELELKKLEVTVESIHENLINLKNREAEMRDVNESTNSRVAWSSMMSLSICIAVSILQLWHLKRYFHRRKLI